MAAPLLPVRPDEDRAQEPIQPVEYHRRIRTSGLIPGHTRPADHPRPPSAPQPALETLARTSSSPSARDWPPPELGPVDRLPWVGLAGAWTLWRRPSEASGPRGL